MSNTSLSSDILRGGMIILASAIDTLFHKTIVRVAVHRFDGGGLRFVTKKLKDEFKNVKWTEIIHGLTQDGGISGWLMSKLKQRIEKESLYTKSKIDECWEYCSETKKFSETPESSNFEFDINLLSRLAERRDQIAHWSDLNEDGKPRLLLIEDLELQVNNAKKIPAVIKAHLEGLKYS